MTEWQQRLAGLAHKAEGRFDILKGKLLARFDQRDLVILPYLGYGGPQALVVRGRVLRNPKDSGAEDNNSLWDDLADMARRFATAEIPFPQIRARYGDVTGLVTGDEEGFFTIALNLPQPVEENGRFWHEVTLDLVQPAAAAPVQAVAQILVPPAAARFGIISDLDDTVMLSHATNLLRMFRTVFLSNARQRLPFPGVAAFYRALHAGQNPLIYLSSSPWNLYDLFMDFFALHDIPQAPLFLRDWGITQVEILPTEHQSHKLAAIRELLDFFGELPFILIGDSGQQDPEIYAQVVHDYPGRISAVYIRDVTPGPARREAVQKLAAAVESAGSTLILAADTLAMAAHAAAQGWIAGAALGEISAEIAEE